MIRRFNLADIPRLVELMQLHSEGKIEAWGQTFVAEIEGNIRGFVVCRIWDEMGAAGHIKRIGKMEPIVVEPNHPLLVTRLYERAKCYFEDCGCEAMEGLIGSDNRELSDFAEAHGWYQRTPMGRVYRKDL